jgi:epoxyqueuosine reductase
VALRIGPLNFPSLRKDSRDKDPYWDFFINTPAADLSNYVTEMMRRAPEGNVFPTKADIHSPEITAGHVKELARYLGADLVGIAKLDPDVPAASALAAGAEDKAEQRYPFAVVCAVRADYRPSEAPGIGGQVPVQNGLFITFLLSAWIRELGFRATAKSNVNAERLAVAAGLGQLNSEGRLVTAQYGSQVHVADAILTDLPLVADR